MFAFAQGRWFHGNGKVVKYGILSLVYLPTNFPDFTFKNNQI